MLMCVQLQRAAGLHKQAVQLVEKLFAAGKALQQVGAGLDQSIYSILLVGSRPLCA